MCVKAREAARTEWERLDLNDPAGRRSRRPNTHVAGVGRPPLVVPPARPRPAAGQAPTTPRSEARMGGGRRSGTWTLRPAATSFSFRRATPGGGGDRAAPRDAHGNARVLFSVVLSPACGCVPSACAFLRFGTVNL